jgi:hypothetical protein
LASAIGGGAGKAVENARTGQQALQGNDITAGLSQGAGELAGIGLTKGIGKLGGALKNSGIAAKKAEGAKSVDAAANQARQEEIQQELDKSVPPTPERLAAEKEQLYGRNMGSTSGYGADAKTLLQSHGLDNPNAFAENAQTVGNAVSDSFQAALENAASTAKGASNIPIAKDTVKQFMEGVQKDSGLLGNEGWEVEVTDPDTGQVVLQNKTIANSGKGSPIQNHATRIASAVRRAAQSSGINLNTDDMITNPKVTAQQMNNFLRQVGDIKNAEYDAYDTPEGTAKMLVGQTVRKRTTGLLNNLSSNLRGAYYNRPGVMEAVGKNSEAIRGSVLNDLRQGGIPEDAQQSVLAKVDSILANKKISSTMPGEPSMWGDVSPYIDAATTGRNAAQSLQRNQDALTSLRTLQGNIAERDAGLANQEKNAGLKAEQRGLKQEAKPAPKQSSPVNMVAGLAGGAEALLRGDPLGGMALATAPALAHAVASPEGRILSGGVLSKLGTKPAALAAGGIGNLVGSTPNYAQGAGIPGAELTAQVTPTGAQSMEASPYAQDLNNLIATAMLPSGGAFTSAGSNAASVLGSLGPELFNQVSNAAKAQAAAQEVQNLFAQTGGGGGLLGGLGTRLGETFTGGPAGLAPGQNQLGAAEANLGGILHNATPGAAAPAMPNVMSSQGTAQSALQGIQALIQSMYGQGSGVVPQSI